MIQALYPQVQLEARAEMAVPGAHAGSLQASLARVVLAIFVVSWLVSAIVTTLSARAAFLRETDRALDSLLAVAETVGSSAGDGLSGDDRFLQRLTRQEERGDGRLLYRLTDVPGETTFAAPSLNIWTENSQFLVGNETPAFPGPDVATPLGQAMEVAINGEIWRIMYRYDGRRQIWYAAGASGSQLSFGGTELLLRLLAPLVIVLPLTLLALYLGVSRGVRPLGQLARAIESRQRQASLVSVEVSGVPRELQPVVEALNHYLQRLANTLEDEKSFTANAAHELQTPLAAISAEVQLSLRLVEDEGSRELLRRIQMRVERASYSVRQMLVLARLDPRSRPNLERIDLHDTLLDVLAEQGRIASERGLRLDLDVPEGLEIAAERDLLFILLRNLLGNALRYTPAGGQVSITGRAGLLRLSNDSPQVVAIDRLTDRFYRGENPEHESGAAGVGLGLSIVRRISELHGFRMQLAYQSALKQFEVRINFSAGTESHEGSGEEPRVSLRRQQYNVPPKGTRLLAT